MTGFVMLNEEMLETSATSKAGFLPSRSGFVARMSGMNGFGVAVCSSFRNCSISCRHNRSIETKQRTEKDQERCLLGFFKPEIISSKFFSFQFGIDPAM